MSPLRFVLILLLTVALDLSPLPPPHAGGGEVNEEFEEAAHRGSSRRPYRLVRDTVAGSVAHEIRTTELARSRPLPPAPSRPAAGAPRIRKLPPPSAESSSAPDAH